MSRKNARRSWVLATDAQRRTRPKTIVCTREKLRSRFISNLYLAMDESFGLSRQAIRNQIFTLLIASQVNCLLPRLAIGPSLRVRSPGYFAELSRVAWGF